jgi:hypothetical protein
VDTGGGSILRIASPIWVRVSGTLFQPYKNDWILIVLTDFKEYRHNPPYPYV